MPRDIAPDRPRLLMSPRGRPLTQSRVVELAAGPGPLIVCGRFEGVDQRVIEARRLEEVSIGDYVLSGGEIAALALIDACVRLLPGVMGKLASGTDESFSDSLLEYPQYTRPQAFEGRPIPEILTSGDHAKVAAWRQAEAEALTAGAAAGSLIRHASEASPTRDVAKNAQKTRRTGDKPQPLPYTSAKSAQWQDRSNVRAARAMAGWGAPPMEIFR